MSSVEKGRCKYTEIYCCCIFCQSADLTIPNGQSIEEIRYNSIGYPSLKASHQVKIQLDYIVF